MYNIYIIGQPISSPTYRATVTKVTLSARPSPPHFYCFYIYSCLFPCKTAREYFLVVLFLFEIS